MFSRNVDDFHLTTRFYLAEGGTLQYKMSFAGIRYRNISLVFLCYISIIHTYLRESLLFC
jgi:hypothetical protein